MNIPSEKNRVGSLKDFFRDKDQAHGRQVVAEFVHSIKGKLGKEPARILDVGCGEGRELLSCKSILGQAELFGIDMYDSAPGQGLENGISVHALDLENGRFPFDEQSFDIIICNHVLEHLKNIFHVIFEISRVVRPGGYVIFGVPNLAAWHNRLFLLLGVQPRCIRVISGHVRGFTYSDFRRLITSTKMLDVVKRSGDAFYGCPSKVLAHVLAGFMPSLAGTIHLLLRRNETPYQASILEALTRKMSDTDYTTGVDHGNPRIAASIQVAR